MADKKIRIGSMEDFHVYDDVDYSSGIKSEGPIEAANAVNPTELVALSQLGTYVQGPGASTDNAVARFNGAGGNLIKDSKVIVDNNGSVNIPTGEGYKVNNIKVLTNQQAAETDAAAVSAITLGVGVDLVDRATFNTDLGTLVTEINALKSKINNLLAKLRTHGIIAT